MDIILTRDDVTLHSMICNMEVPVVLTEAMSNYIQ